LIVSHRYDRNSESDILVLKNEKDEDAGQLYFDNVIITAKHSVSTNVAIPVVRAGGAPVEVPVIVHSGVGGARRSLSETLHDNHEKAISTARIYYSGPQHRFYREFVLEETFSETVTWEPAGLPCLDTSTEAL
jgi:hypothetical protein